MSAAVGPECGNCGHLIAEGEEVTKEIPGQFYTDKRTGSLEFGQTDEAKVVHYECPEPEDEW